MSEGCVVNEFKGACGKVEIVDNWNGSGQKVAVKTYYPRQCMKSITFHEAAVLAYLDGKANYPRLICTDPDRGIEYLEKKILSDIVCKGKRRDGFWPQVLCSCA